MGLEFTIFSPVLIWKSLLIYTYLQNKNLSTLGVFLPKMLSKGTISALNRLLRGF